MSITDTADRDALLRLLDLQNDISDLINRYADLGAGVVCATLRSKADEALAYSFLPPARPATQPKEPPHE